MLLAKGADVNAKANNGATALMLAAQNGHKEIVEMLLAKGAKNDATAKSGESAPMNPSANGCKRIVPIHAGHSITEENLRRGNC